MERSSAENLSFEESLQYRCKKNIGVRANKEHVEAAYGLSTGATFSQAFPKSSPRSRGYLLISRPCGHIVKAAPIYKAESPSQVFLAVLSTLYCHVIDNKIPFENWKNIFIIYDNVCNLDRIHAARNPLPLLPPFDRLWLETRKVIDVFHLSNHKRPECYTVYHPKNIREVHPDLQKRNTEVAEQNFAWMGKFKAVLNSIPRNRQIV